jgi:transcriptional regulator with GAF, ATPase, and Fis domain
MLTRLHVLETPSPTLSWAGADMLDEAEREHISEIVEMTNGLVASRGSAAEVLGVPPSTLRYRVKKPGINS